MNGYASWARSRPTGPTFAVWLAITIGINMLALMVVDRLFADAALRTGDKRSEQRVRITRDVRERRR